MPEKKCQSSGPYIPIKIGTVLSSVMWCWNKCAWPHCMIATTPEDITGAGLLVLPHNAFFSEIDIK